MYTIESDIWRKGKISLQNQKGKEYKPDEFARKKEEIQILG